MGARGDPVHHRGPSNARRDVMLLPGHGRALRTAVAVGLRETPCCAATHRCPRVPSGQRHRRSTSSVASARAQFSRSAGRQAARSRMSAAGCRSELAPSSGASSALRFEVLDVFTSTPCGGNPLAVVYGAEGLSDAALQKIAAEFNYSETTFVLPPADPTSATARVRIFTPVAELPFAGHPTVGTACALGWQGAVFGRSVNNTIILEEQSGLVPVTRVEGEWWELEAPMPFTVSPVGQGLSTADAASCLGIDDADVCSEGRLAALGGAVPYALVELGDVAALGRCTPNVSDLERCGKILAWVRVTADDVDIRCRMFNARGVEDPATGAASCCLMGLLATLGVGDSEAASARQEPSKFSRLIAQGIEMGRPSLLRGECEQIGTVPMAVRVSGQCVPMMAGEIRREHFEMYH